MILNEYGDIIFDEINNIEKIDEFIVMPDHIHLILFIENKNTVETSIYRVSNNNELLNNNVSNNNSNKENHY
jgi:REP element-mobilizing transposase RayT